jgi:hypothetical protein
LVFSTDESLVDTGEFFMDSVDVINPEVAMVAGPLSFQGEYFHVFTGADEVGDPQFWGWYVYLSYFLTGDHRRYKASSGTFSQVVPKHHFHPLRGEWGVLGTWAQVLLYRPHSCKKFCIQTNSVRRKPLPVLADPGYWFPDTGCFWISLLEHS